MFKKTISLILSLSLLLTQLIFAQGVAELNIGKYLSQMPALNTDSFRPPHLRYVSYDIKSNDFKLLLDQGDLEKSPGHQDARLPEKSENALKVETKNLFNYFLIGLTLPNDKFWVNLRPDAPEQIIDPELEKTDLGKIMLEADLQLKKDTAGLTSPQTPEGKEYWNKLHKRAGELFGTENITIPTITRPWIVPGEVIIRESKDSSYIYKANLNVLLEEDYLKSSQLSAVGYQQYEFKDPRMKELNQYSTQLIRELILPKLTQEVNTSKRYAQLRQVFFSLILSRWFKDRYRNKPGQYSSLIDSHNLDKLTSKEAWNKAYYFNEYKKSFQQGEYNLKEQIPTPTGQVIRSYVSGGIYNLLPASISSFISIGSSSPVDMDTVKNIGGFFVIVSTLAGLSFITTMLMKMHIKAAWKIRQDQERVLIEVVNSILGELSELKKTGKLSSDDYGRIVETLGKNKNNLENAIRDILGYLKVLANTQKEQAEEIGKIILKLEKSLPSSGSSPLTIEEARKLLEEYKKEIQGFPLKYLKEGQKKNNLESLLRAYFLNSKHNENIAIAAGYLSTVAREELRDSILSEEWDKKQIKIAEIVAALTAKTSEQEIVSPLTLEDARARLDKTVADYKAIITSSIEEVEANATKSAKLLLLQKLTPYKKFVENTEKMNKGSLFRISISAVDMIRAAKDKYIPETDAAIEYYRDKEEALKILQGCKEAMKKLVRELGNLEQDISASLYSEKEQEAGSLPLTQEEAKKSGASSALKQEVGGIDFTWISYLTQPMGSFQGLDLRLPLLSKAELEGIDISRELAAMEQMVNARIDVSTDRLKCLLAAMSQKDAFTAQRETQLLPLILRLCWLKEERGVETTPDFRAVLLIADTGLFVAQGKRSIL